MAVEVAQQFADGMVSNEERKRVRGYAELVADSVDLTREQEKAARAATFAVSEGWEVVADKLTGRSLARVGNAEEMTAKAAGAARLCAMAAKYNPVNSANRTNQHSVRRICNRMVRLSGGIPSNTVHDELMKDEYRRQAVMPRDIAGNPFHSKQLTPCLVRRIRASWCPERARSQSPGQRPGAAERQGSFLCPERARSRCGGVAIVPFQGTGGCRSRVTRGVAPGFVI
jgi:hypothetical protein